MALRSCIPTEAVLCILISSLGFIAAADINTMFQTWLRPPESGRGVAQSSSHSEHISTELRQALEGFLLLQGRRAIGRFINATPGSQQAGGLAGIITAASRLVDADKNSISENLSGLGQLIGRIPEERDFPLVRRVTIAGLALRYGKHGPFTSLKEGAIVQDILLQFFHQLRQTAKQKGVMEYAHVSKSGGTSFCRLAKENDCQSESFGWGNCLIKAFDDGPRYIDVGIHKQLQSGSGKTRCSRGFKRAPSARGKEMGCSERRQHLLDLGYSMYANEYTALGGQEDPALAHPCRNMFTVLEIRHPYGRVISHIKHVWFMYNYHCGADRAVYFASGSNTSHWAALMPAPTNNYLIRSLLGEKVFNSPLGNITRQHLDLARTALAEQYDVVLVLEDKPLFKQGVRYGLGWGVDTMHANSRGDGSSDDQEGMPLDLDALWELNKLDVELYQFGALMARLDAIVYEAARLVDVTAAEAAAPPSPSSEHPAKVPATASGHARKLSRALRGAEGGTSTVAARRIAASGSSLRRPVMAQQQQRDVTATSTRRGVETSRAGRAAVLGGVGQACGWIGGFR